MKRRKKKSENIQTVIWWDSGLTPWLPTFVVKLRTPKENHPKKKASVYIATEMCGIQAHLKEVVWFPKSKMANTNSPRPAEHSEILHDWVLKSEISLLLSRTSSCFLFLSSLVTLMLVVILIGDSATGKSSIMTRLIRNEWNPSITSTLGVNLWIKTIDVNSRIVKGSSLWFLCIVSLSPSFGIINSIIALVNIWDTAGQEVFRTMLPSFYQSLSDPAWIWRIHRGAQGAFLVYDITNRITFDHIDGWLKELRHHASPDVILLIGNKVYLPFPSPSLILSLPWRDQCDLQDLREVTIGEALEYAQSRGLAFMETSALDATGVHEAFLEVITRKSHLTLVV
jgi:Ras-related protein Rab-11A